MAAAVRRLAGDPALRDRLRTGGRATAEAHPAEASHAALRRALEAAAASGRGIGQRTTGAAYTV